MKTDFSTGNEFRTGTDFSTGTDTQRGTDRDAAPNTQLLMDSIKQIDPELVDAARQAGSRTADSRGTHKYLWAAAITLILVVGGIAAGLVIGSRLRARNGRDPSDITLSEQTAPADHASPGDAATLVPSPASTGAPAEFDRMRYAPDYDSTSTLHAAEFLELLEQKGYRKQLGYLSLDGGDRKIMTDGIKAVYNVTPKAVAQETADVEVFYVKPAGSAFLKVKDELYCYSASDFLQLYLWDYDGNGVKDLVTFYHRGTGTHYMSLAVTDVAAMEDALLFDRSYPQSQSGASVWYDGEAVYVDGIKLEYNGGGFDRTAFSICDTLSDGNQQQALYALYSPDYNSTDTLHADEFLALLRQGGFIYGGEVVTNYNINNIDAVYNITPEGISRAVGDTLELFHVKAFSSFVKYNNTIVRVDLAGFQYLQLYLWDYDGNGTADLFEYYTHGSGMFYISCDVLDLTTFDRIPLITRDALQGRGLPVRYADGAVFVDGVRLEYSGGRFNIDAAGNVIPGDEFFRTVETAEKPFELGVENGCIRLIRVYDTPELTAWSEGYGMRREDNGPTDPAVVLNNAGNHRLTSIFSILSNKPLDTAAHTTGNPPLISLMLSTPSDRPLTYKYRIDLYEHSGGTFARFIDLMTQTELGCVTLTDEEIHLLFILIAPCYGFELGLPEYGSVVRMEVSTLPAAASYHRVLTGETAENAINSFVLSLRSLHLAPTENDGFMDGMVWVIEFFYEDGSSSTLRIIGNRLSLGGNYYRIDQTFADQLENKMWDILGG